jgi:hypothetical protein
MQNRLGTSIHSSKHILSLRFERGMGYKKTHAPFLSRSTRGGTLAHVASIPWERCSTLSYNTIILSSQRGKCAFPLSATMNVFVRAVTSRQSRAATALSKFIAL